MDWGKISFEHPGVIERNLQVSGSAISGFVIDEITGDVIKGEEGRVTAQLDYSRHSEIKRVSTDFDETGRFFLTGLKSGLYHLEVEPKRGFPPTMSFIEFFMTNPVTDVEIKENQKVEGVLIRRSNMGGLQLQISNNYYERFQQFTFSMDRFGELTRSYPLSPLTDWDGDGMADYPMEMKAGEWTISFAFPEYGIIERAVKIVPGEVTKLILDEHALKPFQGKFAVNGKLVRNDGSPARNSKLSFRPDHVPSRPGPEWQGEDAMTDERGHFLLEGLEPGMWRISTWLPETESWLFLQKLVITNESESSIFLNLVIPSGSISGTLIDDHTGRLLDFEQFPCRVSLSESHDRRNSFCSQNRVESSGFNLCGIPPGDYYLVIQSQGYKRYESGPLSLRKDEQMDLGEIPLQPCGVLDLDIVNEAGEPLWLDKHFSPKIFCNNQQYREGRGWSPSRKPRYDQLPWGLVKILIRSSGYKDHEFEVHLDPAQPREVKVVLQRE
jgi:hypothetical protein